MGLDTGELREGLVETRKYLLSHHVPSEYHRCYSPVVAGRQLHVCARCLGIYPGIVFGILVTLLARPPLLLVAVMPLPALLDWSLTTFTDRVGSNPVRTITGLLLGSGYGLGLGLLFDGEFTVLAIGFGYAIVAAALLARSL
ncbi:DUF2085 domain-containing protein [Halovenus sp. HT40]|uniref:DUF2085 domain-containing protein n=1 Tax=Halovenus sp. HT40 TaxID=3126691 RepID=UPI00300F2F6F